MWQCFTGSGKVLLSGLYDYGGISEAVSARIGKAWKKFRELSVVLLLGKQGLSLM